MKNNIGVKSVGLPALLRGDNESDNHSQFLQNAGYSDYLGECKEEFLGRFMFRACALIGMATDRMSIASTKSGKVIGYVSAANLPAFMRGGTSFFEPVENWKTMFSIELIYLLRLEGK